MVERRCCAYVLGHLGWPILMIISLSIAGFCQFVHPVDTYESDEYSHPVNASQPPFYFAFIADVHLTHVDPDRTANVLAKLSNISRNINPPVLGIGGDITDGSNSTNVLAFHRAFEDNWKVQNETLLSSGLYEEGRVVAPTAGNHDMFMVTEDTDEKNMYRKYILKDNGQFVIRTVQFDNFSVPVNLVMFSPLKTPMTSFVLGIMPPIDKDDLTVLDDTLKVEYRNVIFTHFPYHELWSPDVSRTGLSSHEIFRKAHLFVAGHLHPSYFLHSRQKNTGSVVVRAFFESTSVAMGFVDIGGSGIHEFQLGDRENVLITYPIDKAQLTGRCVFNRKSFQIRAILFADAAQSLDAIIDGENVGRMTCNGMVRRGNYFYTLNVDVSPGDHVLRIGNREISFFVGDYAGGSFEWTNRVREPQVLIITPLFFTLYMALCYAIPWSDKYDELLTRFRLYIFGEDVTVEWYETLVCVFLYFTGRSWRVPSWFRWHVAFCSLCFAIIPLYVQQVDDSMATAWIWGISVLDTFKPFPMLWVFQLVYILSLFCVIVAICLWYECDTFDTMLQYEFGLAWMAFVVGSTGNMILTYWAGEWFTLLSAPINLIPILSAAHVLYRFMTDVTQSANPERDDEELLEMVDIRSLQVSDHGICHM